MLNSPPSLKAGIMNSQPPKEATPCEYAGILGSSDDSEEDPSPEDQLAVAWEDRPILERLGLSSGVDMTEDEVESAFTRLAMGFRCDQYTLSQRLRAEEHGRAVAQENLTLELQRTKHTLQSLRGRCMDSERSDMLGRIEASLDTVLGGMDDVISAAEVLGAVHQEARVSRSVEVMQSHVEHLRRRHAAERVELLETRKLLHRSRGRLHSDSAEDGDIRHLFIRQGSQQQLLRRRVSFTLIPTQTQISDLEAKFQEACRTSADTDSQGPEEGAVTQATRKTEVSAFGSPSRVPADHALLPRQTSSQSQEDDSDPLRPPSPPQRALRHRRRSAILAQQASTEVTGSEVTGSDPGSESGAAEASELSEADPGQVTQPSVTPSERLPLSCPWLSRLCRVLLALVAFLLCVLLALASLLWGLRPPPRWTGNTAT